MSAIQIKDVPDDVHAELKRRAAAENRSLQEFLLERLIREVRSPPIAEVLRGAGSRAGGEVTLSAAARMVRQERAGR